jgi:membrane-associated phospholipid phosphatase
MRGTGLHGLLAGLPDVVVVCFTILTQLGDVWFLFAVLGTLYWSGGRFPGVGRVLSRRRAAFLIALALGALALTTGLKALFGLPRPPGAGDPTGIALVPEVFRPLYADAATGEGFGFPSGHALGTTVAWGGTALLAEVGRRRDRVVIAAVVVTVVSVSRLVLGVHYLVDVVVGITVGLAYLAFVLRVGDEGELPGRAFSIALGVALLGLLVGGYGSETMTVLGATLGARIAWGALGERALAVESTTGYATALLGIVVLGGGFGAVAVLDPTPYVAFLANALVLAGVVALPLVGDIWR